ncbi:MAG: lipid-A-disaccharide synthase [Salinisphaera sp.]|nr:lipid-A-disaccharide synthase [Salinisphaera sp.]
MTLQASPITNHQSRRHPRIALVAGEISGDYLGAGLIDSLRTHYPDAVFEGVAGPAMRAAGCQPLADIEALSLFGIAEIAGQIPRLLALRRSLLRHFLAHRPDVFVGIDAPAFNTGLERRLRRAGIPTVHYVCPTAWAWRQGRVRGLRRAVDLMLAIFPFEEAFFAAHRVPVRYVGHPLADTLSPCRDKLALRKSLGLTPERRWLAVLPGSRGSEVQRLGPVFIDSLARLVRRFPRLGLVAPMASPALRARFQAQCAALAPQLDLRLIDGAAREVLGAADVALVTSGTATLEAMLLGTPMVVAYVISPLTYHLVTGLRLVHGQFASMPNLLAGRALVPELLQAQARPELIALWAQRLLDSSRARTVQTQGFAALRNQLRCDANRNAAAAVAGVLAARRS